MSYPEYTECANRYDAADRRKQGVAPWGFMVEIGLATLIANASAIVVIAGILGIAKLSILWGPLAISVLVAALAALVTYCDWWLKYRLICLDDDKNHCAIGFVAEVEDPWEKETGFLDQFDTDYTMNIGVLNTWFDGTNNDLDQVGTVQPFGYLLKAPANDLVEQVGFKLTGKNTDEKDYPPTSGKPRTLKSMKVLHVEFEGGGVHTLRDWLRGLIILLLAAEALAAACAAGLFWACILLLVLAVFLPALGAMAIGDSISRKANPADIDKALASLSVGDIVIVSGRWIYDAGHVDEDRGWNEIHPIRHCQIIKEGVFDGDWGAVSLLTANTWCELVGWVQTPEVQNEQKKPEHTWEIHPMIDGCVPMSEPPAVLGPNITSVSNVAFYSNCYHNYTVAAKVTDGSSVSKVELWYRFSPQVSWQTKLMVLNSNSGLYEASIEDLGSATYFVRAGHTDGTQTDSAQFATFLYCVA